MEEMIGTIAVDRVALHEMEIPLFARMVDGRNPKSVITRWQETDGGRRAQEEEETVSSLCFILNSLRIFI